MGYSKETITRRKFIRDAALVTTALATPGARLINGRVSKFKTQLNALNLTRFVDQLPVPSRVQPVSSRPDPRNPAVKLPYYRIEMRQFEMKLHRDIPPTKQWGYDAMVPGPTFETEHGQGILVEWVNRLPTTHLLPIDHRLHGAEASLPESRAVVHLHGGKTPPESDGYPESWYPPGKSAVCHYPLNQDAAMLWYHDHAMGINRLNIYAGMMGVFFVRDEFEKSLKLPSGEYEIPLVLYDRTFDLEGQLDYPISNRPNAPWVPEAFGDAMLVNGKVFPYLKVEPRKYRFRILNGANSRFFSLRLSNGQTMHQIGTDLGFLPVPIETKEVMLFPAERADIIVDFSGSAGEQISLRNENTDLMQFQVSSAKSRDNSVLPSTLRPIARLHETEAIKTRTLTLIEYTLFAGGSMTMLLNDKHWSDPITERPVIDTVEIWNIVNLTEDAHPIHLHLVRMQILDRRPFDIFAYTTLKKVVFTGPAGPPEANEAGWKDTIRCDSGVITRLIVRFEGYLGRYVWHCHILEHEDNEMMRPFEVISGAARAAAANECSVPQSAICGEKDAKILICQGPATVKR